MARVIYNADEADPNMRIEDGIRDLSGAGHFATANGVVYRLHKSNLDEQLLRKLIQPTDGVPVELPK